MILGIETSTKRASLALFDPDTDGAVWQSEFTTDRAHNAVIFEPIVEMLELYRDKINGIVVGIGPGSYSGVRVGIAVANGLSLSLGLPCQGRSSLEAWEVEENNYAVIGDARRRSFFVADVKERKLQREPDLLGDAEMEKRLQELRAAGVTLYTADAKVAEKMAGVIISHPNAVQLSKRASERDPSEWSKQLLEPHYLRAPYITTPKKKHALLDSNQRPPD